AAAAVRVAEGHRAGVVADDAVSDLGHACLRAIDPGVELHHPARELGLGLPRGELASGLTGVGLPGPGDATVAVRAGLRTVSVPADLAEDAPLPASLAGGAAVL